MRNNGGTTLSPAGQSILVGGRWESSCFPFFLYPAGYQQEGVAYSGVGLWVCVRVGRAQDVCFNDHDHRDAEEHGAIGRRISQVILKLA